MSEGDKATKPKNSISKKFIWESLAITFITTGLVILVRMLGGLQNWELQAYDHLLNFRPDLEGADNKFLVITVDEADIQYQDQNQKYKPRIGSLSDKALLALLEKVTHYQPAIIASDIVHDFEFETELQEYFKHNKSYISICRVRNEENQLDGIKPPKKFPLEQLGFTNFAQDFDGVIRRQIIGMESDDICPPEYSFSLRIALSYLRESGTQTPEGFIKIRDVIFKPLEHNSGGYQLPKKETGGYQILLNYRASNPIKVKLREILTGSLNSQLPAIVKDKIILIGVADEKNDLHLTPYSTYKDGARMSGVFIHAQMASQIISAVTEKRPLFKWLPQWVENIWIFFWALLGNIIGFLWHTALSNRTKIGISIVIFISLYIVSFMAFLAAIWIPIVPPFLVLAITQIFILLIPKIFNHNKDIE